MSQSRQQPVNSDQPPPEYSFRRGTLRELIYRDIYRDNSRLSIWLVWIVAVLLAASGIRTALEVGLQVWDAQSQAYLFEYGTYPEQPSWENWQQILLKSSFAGFLLIFPLLVGIPLYALSRWSLSREYPDRAIWLAQQGNQIVGGAVLFERKNYTLLANIYIDPEHQWQGVGTHLLWNCVNSARKPVYLLCLPRLQGFYRRMGFVSVPKQDLPREMRSYLFGFRGMGLFKPATLPQSSTTSRLPPNISLRSLTNFRAWWQTYQTFWYSQRFRQSRLLVAIRFVVMLAGLFLLASVTIWSLQNILGLTWLSNFEFIVLGIRVSSLAIALCLSGFLLGKFRTLAGWQEWAIQYYQQPIGYIHICCQANASILYNLHVASQYRQYRIGAMAIAHLSRRIPLPIYTTCPRQEVGFYIEMGFVPTNQKDLPFELQIFQPGGYVALKLTADASVNLSSQTASTIPLPLSETSNRQNGTKAQKSRKQLWVGVAIALFLFIASPLFNRPQISSSDWEQPTQTTQKPQPPSNQIIPPSHRGSTSSVAFTPDGQTMVVANWDNSTIEVWDFGRNALLRRIENDSQGIPIICLSSDGQILIAASKDGTIKIRDFHSGQLRKTLKAHGKSVLAMAVSPDGRRLVSSGEDRMLKIWDLQSSKLLKQIKDAHQGVVQQIAINPDNQTFATRGYLGTEVKIWNLERGNEILSLEGHTEEIAALAIAPDGQTLISSGKDRQIKVWDYQQGSNLKTWDIPKPLHSLAITSDGQRLVGGNYLGRRVSIWDINSGKLLQSFKGNDWEVRGISPDNQKIVVGRYQVEILALNGKLPPQRLGGSWQIRTLAIASDNQTLITGNVNSQIAIWDLASKSLQRTLKVTSGNIESLAISSDRQTLAVGTSSGALEIWDYPRGE